MPKLESMLWCCLDQIVDGVPADVAVVAAAAGAGVADAVDFDDVEPQHKLPSKRLPESVKSKEEKNSYNLISNCLSNVTCSLVPN